MANIGEQLLQSESGMQRIDDTNINIDYSTTNLKNYNDLGAVQNFYNNTTHFNWVSGTIEEKTKGIIVFYFKGCKIQLICAMAKNTILSDANIVKIDGIKCGELYYTMSDIGRVLSFQKLDLSNKIHKVEIELKGNPIALDCIDIDGYMCTQEDYELQEAKNKLFPVRVADDTIRSEDNVSNYTATLVNGERQLLLLNTGDMYLSDGKGSHVKMGGSNDIHDNKNVLDLLTTDGTDLYFNGKNVQKVELEDGKYGYSATFLNVVENSSYNIPLTSGSTLCEQIVQVWEFTEGNNDITTVAKTFNNIEKNNFYYDSESIEFADDTCKIKDKFILNNTLNIETKFYETKLNKTDFIELINLRNEVSE